MAERSKNYRHSTNHQAVIDSDTRLIVLVGQPLPGNRHHCKTRELSGAKDAVGRTTAIAGGGYRSTGPIIPHHPERGQQLPVWKEEHNASHRRGPGPAETKNARVQTVSYLVLDTWSTGCFTGDMASIRLTTTTIRVLEVLLDAPSDQPAWGLSICQHADLGSGTVYPILERLLTHGWIAARMETGDHPGRPARRYYELTGAGRAAARAALDARKARRSPSSARWAGGTA